MKDWIGNIIDATTIKVHYQGDSGSFHLEVETLQIFLAILAIYLICKGVRWHV